MTRPIEPGCLCLSLAHDAPGQCAAMEHVVTGTRLRNRLGVITTQEDGWFVRFNDGRNRLIATRQLIRLDDFDGDEFETAIGKMICKEPIK